MSDLQNSIDYSDLTEEPAPEPQAQPQGALKHVRDALDLSLKKASAAEQEAAQLRRELAIERAQLPDTPLKELFLKAYDGDVTPEAIRAEAERYGVLQATPAAAAPEPVPSVPAAELDQHRAVAQAAVGSSTGGDIDLGKAILAATSKEEVLRIMTEAQSQGVPGINVVSDIAI